MEASKEQQPQGVVLVIRYWPSWSDFSGLRLLKCLFTKFRFIVSFPPICMYRPFKVY